MLNSLKVFVYGTLKPGEPNYQRYCAGKVVEAQRATAKGLLYALPAGYPAMTLGDSLVHGFLLTFKSPAVLKDLDWLEDYAPNRPAGQNEYERRRIQTYNTAEHPLDTAWAYLMSWEQVKDQHGLLLPTGWWSSCGISLDDAEQLRN